MESNYPKELAAWAKKRPTKRRQDAATVAFLAVRDDVKAAMDSGYAVSTIYEHMLETGRIKCSYETFRKHVQRHIKADKETAPPPIPPAMTERAKAKPKKTEPAGIAGFNFNPKPKEDLF